MKDIKQYINNFSILLFLIFFTGIFIRIKLFLSAPSLWLDECALTANIINSSYLDLFKPLTENYQVAPPLFLVIEKFFYSVAEIFTQDLKLLDMSLRLFPLLCGCACCILFAYIIHKIFKNEYFTLITVSVFTFNRLTIFYSNEVKQYILELLIAIIFLILTNNFKNFKTFKQFLFLSLFCVTSVWLSNTSLIYIFIFSVFLFINCLKDKIPFKNYLTYLSIIFFNLYVYTVIYFIPNFYSPIRWFMLSFWSRIDKFFTKELFLTNYYYLTIDMFQRVNMHFEKNIFNTFIPDMLFHFLFYLSLIVLLLISFKYLIKKKLYTILCFITLPSIFFIILSFLRIYPYEGRLVICLLAGFIIILCSPFLYFKKNFLNIILINFIVILMIILNITPNVYKFNIYPSEIRRVYQIMQEENPSMTNIIAEPDQFYCYAKKNINIVCTLQQLYETTNAKSNTLKGDFHIILGEYEILNFKDIDENYLKFIKDNFEILKYVPSYNPKFYYAKIRIK